MPAPKKPAAPRKTAAAKKTPAKKTTAKQPAARTGTGRKLSPEKQTARNALIVKDRIGERMEWNAISKKHNLSPRMCRYVVRRWMEEGGENVTYEQPTQVVDDLLAGYRTDLWELTEAADAAWEQENIPAVVSAVKHRMDARQRAIELLQATGRLPKNLGQLRVIYDVRFLVEQVMEVFDEHQVPVAARRALLDRLGPVIDAEAEEVTEAAA